MHPGPNPFRLKREPRYQDHVEEYLFCEFVAKSLHFLLTVLLCEIVPETVVQPQYIEPDLLAMPFPAFS